jgi:choline dehydrogenase-like flavoprotein
MHYVVGSGPTGVAAATALLDRGLPVTMLDVGIECEPDRMAVVQRMAAREPDDWSPDDVRIVRARPRADESEAPPKLCYGSRFAYAEDTVDLLNQIGTRCLVSYARGGLSNVWGAAVLPAIARDLDDWPLPLDAMVPHYVAVARLMPIAATSDELASVFPLYDRPRGPLRPSRLAGLMLDHMRAHQPALATAGLVFGQSRLAVRSETDEAGAGCRYTGLCLSGCPYFAIWNASDMVKKLQGRRDFTYRPGIVVERLESMAADGGVRIVARAADGSGPTSFIGRRALLACGPLSTLQIVVDSLRAYGRTIPLGFQSYFVLPLLARWNTANVEREARHTLAQVFLEVMDPGISPHTIHLQIYTFNEFILDRVDRFTRWLGPLRGIAQRQGLGRLLAVQGYLHSSEAPAILVTSTYDAAHGRAQLTLRPQSSERTATVVRQVTWKLARHARHLGALPIVPLREIGRPGEGNHVGAAFPLRRVPGEMQTDLLGQLGALPGVHIVDSTSLPSLPATTFTYTVMAHAHRIADSVARLD